MRKNNIPRKPIRPNQNKKPVPKPTIKKIKKAVEKKKAGISFRAVTSDKSWNWSKK